MSNDPFRDPVSRRTLSRGDLEGLLREFEGAWEKQTGERLTSDAFYERYCNGEFDSIFSMSWGSYFEILQRLPCDPAHARLVEELVSAP